MKSSKRKSVSLFLVPATVAFYFVIINMSQSDNQIVVKTLHFLTILGSLYFFKYHLNIKCFIEIKGWFQKFNRIHAYLYLYFFVQILRPLLSASERNTLSVIYDSIFFLFLGISAIFVVHSFRHNHTDPIAYKKQVHKYDLREILDCIFQGYFLFLIIFLFFSIGNIQIQVGPVSLTTNYTNNLIEFFLLFPFLWAYLSKSNAVFNFKAALSIHFVILIAIIHESRSILLSSLILSFFLIIAIYNSKYIKQSLLRVTPFLLLGMVFLLIKLDTLKTLILDLFLLGSTRIIDGTNVTTIVDIDRFLQIKAAIIVVTSNIFNSFFGYGYLQSDFVIAPKLAELFRSEAPYLNFINEYGSFLNISTYAMPAILVDFGFIGLIACAYLFAIQIKHLPWRIDFKWSYLRLVSILIIIFQGFTVNYLDCPWFILFLMFGNFLDKIYLQFFSVIRQTRDHHQ